jgi:hypothetical protein
MLVVDSSSLKDFLVNLHLAMINDYEGECRNYHTLS